MHLIPSQKEKMASIEPWLMENGNIKGISKEITRHGRTAHNMSSSSLREKSDMSLVSKVPIGLVRRVLANLREVILGTKLSILFPAIKLAIIAQSYGFGRVNFFFPIRVVLIKHEKLFFFFF